MNRIKFSKLSFGEKLKYLRNEKDVTQDELADMANILPTNIRKYETNIRTPKDDNLRLLANALNCSIYDLKELNCNSEEDVLAIISQPSVLKFLNGALLKLQKNIDEEINYHLIEIEELKNAEPIICDMNLEGQCENE